MEFTPEETEKLKAMMMFVIKKKHNQSGGHSGFHVSDLNPILEDMEKEGKIQVRRTINLDRYFLTKKQYNVR